MTETALGEAPAAIERADIDPLKGGDVYAWAMEQAALIRARRFDAIDVLNVADEIEDVGRSDYRALESRIEIVLLHALKWTCQPERRTRSWSNSIFENRLQIEKLLRESPSLRRRLERIVADAYVDARRRASRETELPLAQFAAACPFSISDVLDAPFEDDER